MANAHPDRRKRRTREHVIADLSIHHVEGHILRCGFTAERVSRDYGLDLYMITYNEVGDLENDFVLFQVKATDHPMVRANRRALAVRVDRGNFVNWVHETYPVILVAYDAQADVAYWLYVQAEFAGKRVPHGHEQITMHVPFENVLDERSIRRFAAAKAAIQAQTKGVRHL